MENIRNNLSVINIISFLTGSRKKIEKEKIIVFGLYGGGCLIMKFVHLPNEILLSEKVDKNIKLL